MGSIRSRSRDTYEAFKIVSVSPGKEKKMTSPASNENSIYRDPTRSIPERVRDLLGHMTLDEKIAQLGSAWVYELLDNSGFSPDKARALMQHGIDHECLPRTRRRAVWCVALAAN
jgi:hypothetical protein